MAERIRYRRRQEQERQASAKKKKRRTVRLVCLAVVAFCALGLGGYCAYDRIMDGSTMGCRISVYGVNVTWMKPEDAAEKLDREFQKKKVVFRENGGDIYEVTLEEAGYSLDEEALTEELTKLKENREPCRILLEKQKDYTVDYQVTWDDAKMKSAFSSEHLEDAAERTESTDAYITFDEETRRYEIVPSVTGTKIENAKLLNHTQSTLNDSFQENLMKKSVTVEVGLSDYQEAEVTETQTALNEKLSELNRKIESYETAEVTYTFGSVEEVLDTETISGWIQAGEDDISLDETAVREYVSQLGLDYNTQYVPRYFTTSNGTEVVISNNEYGYWIDEDGEYEQLCKDLESGEPVKREPVYTTEGNGREGNDDLVGGYVEVDLTNQYLWLYYEGGLIVESAVVTGQPVGVNSKTGEQEDWSTYEGSYPIAYTEHPATLSSDIYGYEVDVQYWMPFVYGQGLHDASWRSSFGGQIYQTNGSHGCVNLPLNVAATIYEYVDAGFPVILYK